MNEIISLLRESGDIKALEDQWTHPREAACKSGAVSEDSTVITFSQVVGLWIVLAAMVAIALVLMALRELELRYVRQSLRQLSARMLEKVSSLGSSFSRSRSSTAATGADMEKHEGDTIENGFNYTNR